MLQYNQVKKRLGAEFDAEFQGFDCGFGRFEGA
jgi:hypothetical protein